MRRRCARRNRAALLAALAMAPALALAGSSPAAAARFQVGSPKDAGPKTLRHAVALANRHPGPDRVTVPRGIDRIALRSRLVVEGPTTLGPGGLSSTLVVRDPRSSSRAPSRGIVFRPRGDRAELTVHGLDLRGLSIFSGGDLRVASTIVRGRPDEPEGFGIYAHDASHVRIDHTRVAGFDHGIAVFGVGRTALGHVKVKRNDTGVLFSRSPGRIEDSKILSNETGFAGSNATIVDSLVARNRPDSGIKADRVTLDRSTVSGNEGYSGGGVQLSSGAITSSTISGNTATGLEFPGRGGGIFVTNYSFGVEVTASTITGNSAEAGGGLYVAFPYYGGETRLSDTIVAGNGAGDCATDRQTPSPAASGGGNVLGSGACVAALGPNDLVTADPLLGPLADNGGPTPTHALLPGSPAIDNALPMGLAADQRGLPRGSEPDSGSFEVQP